MQGTNIFLRSFVVAPHQAHISLDIILDPSLPFLSYLFNYHLDCWPYLNTQYMKIPLTAAAAKSLRSCPTLCNPIDGSPPGSPIPGILQTRTLEWVAISFSNAQEWKVKVKSLSHVQLLVTPWTAAYQAPPSMGFSRQEYWSWGAIAFSKDIY